MAECSGKPTTPCWGTNTQSCGTYPSCLGAPCCTGTGVYTGCAGTVSDSRCPSYEDCDPGCCDATPTGCTGTVSTDCYHLYSNPGDCNADPCCMWEYLPPGHCAKKNCSDIDPGDCAGCGCTTTGTCTKKACSTMPDESACSYCGCTVQGNCTRVACSTFPFTLAGMQNCKSCAGCQCCWHVNETCEVSGDVVCGGIVVEALGQVTHTGGTVDVFSFWKKGGAGAFWYDDPGVNPIQPRGGNPCCP